MKPLPFLVGFTTTTYSGLVYAAPSEGPSWELLALSAGSVILTLVMAWVKSVAKKQEDTDKMVIELQKALLSRYHPKEDIEGMIRDVRSALSELRDDNRRWQEKMEKKFDHLESIYGR